jgi:hypothetical protein
MYNINSGYGAKMMQAFHNVKPTLGKVFFVGDSSTVDLSRVQQLFGVDPDGDLRYFDDIDSAIGACTADRGDVILVAPGHTETITGTDITLDVAGVSIIGLGEGTLQPQIKHNHADAEVSVAANNCTIENIRFTADVTGVKVAIEIEDGVVGTTVRGCRFDVVTTGTDEFLVSVRTNDASNRATIDGNFFNMGLGGAVAAVSFTKDTDETVVRNNTVMGDYSTACIEGITTLSTNVDIDGNLLINGLTGALGTEPGIQLLTGSTGVIRNNYIVCNLATKAASVVADACMLFENYYNEDVSGAATGGIIGTASADD